VVETGLSQGRKPQVETPKSQVKSGNPLQPGYTFGTVQTAPKGPSFRRLIGPMGVAKMDELVYQNPRSGPRYNTVRTHPGTTLRPPPSRSAQQRPAEPTANLPAVCATCSHFEAAMMVGDTC
jgi:hypothetical protein